MYNPVWQVDGESYKARTVYYPQVSQTQISRASSSMSRRDTDMPPQGLCSFLPAVASARTIDERGNGLALLVLLFSVCAWVGVCGWFQRGDGEVILILMNLTFGYKLHSEIVCEVTLYGWQDVKIQELTKK